MGRCGYGRQGTDYGIRYLEAGECKRRVPVRLDLRVDVRAALQKHTRRVLVTVHRSQHEG